MKVKNSIVDNIIDIICWGLALCIPIYLIICWKNIPNEIPMHYDLMGNVDRWGNKTELIILPIMTFLMCSFISVIELFPQVWNTGVKITEENKERVYRILKNMVKTLKLVVIADFSFMTIYSLMGKNLPIWFSPVFLTLVFGDLIFWLVKLVKVSKSEKE